MPFSTCYRVYFLAALSYYPRVRKIMLLSKNNTKHKVLLMSKFDDLIDDFLNPDERPKKDKKDIAKELRQKINDLSNITDPKELDKKIFETLGKPNQIIKVVKNGVEVVQLVWHTPEGDFNRVLMKDLENRDEPDFEKLVDMIQETIREAAGVVLQNNVGLENEPFDEKTVLNKQLDAAIEKEDYTLAAELRDKIRCLKDEPTK
jgi:hypothetical protein